MFLKSRYDILTGRPGHEIPPTPCRGTVVYGGPGSGKTRCLIDDLIYQITKNPSKYAIFLDNVSNIQILNLLPPDIKKRTMVFQMTQDSELPSLQKFPQEGRCLYIDNFDRYSLHSRESFRELIYTTERVFLSSSKILGYEIPDSWEKLMLNANPHPSISGFLPTGVSFLRQPP
jgi:hypothetical protein